MMITSVANSRVKRVIQLNQKAKSRRSEGVYIVEGPRMFIEADQDEIEEIYVSQNFRDAEIFKNLEGRPYETVSQEVFARMSDTMTPQGILCVMRRREYGLTDLLGSVAPLLLILEDIQDPGNLGTILRAGEGAGIDGVIMSRDTVDIYNPKTIRSTMGSIYRIPFLYSDSLKETVSQLKNRGIHIYAAHLKGSQPYDEADYRGGSAFLIGNEGNGLKDETAKLAQSRILIPMRGKVESLNAAMAATILMYEAGRQRRQGKVHR